MIKEQFIRNLGVMSAEEIELLHSKCIAIAGCGCIGGFTAELLARMGIGELRLADPDVFDVSNINRQCAATHSTVGRSKAEALSEHLSSINPELRMSLYTDGITDSNAELFLEGADYVVDAIDYFSFPSAVALHRAARKKGLPIITAVALGFGTSVLVFSPEGMTLEQYVGIPEDTPLEALEHLTFPPGKYTTQLPSYVKAEDVQRWLEMRTIPTISVGQALGPGVLVSQMILHLLGRKQPNFVPDYFQLQLEA